MDGTTTGAGAVAESVEPSRSRRRLLPSTATFAVVEAGALVLWMVLGRSQWFLLDEWDFLAARKAGDLGDLFRPHNEHWITVPILLVPRLYWPFGLRTYFPYR